MHDEQLMKRISFDVDVMVGKPVIRGTRLSVEYILNLLAHGAQESDILAEYDGLTKDDILACLLFASQALSTRSFMPLDTKSA